MKKAGATRSFLFAERLEKIDRRTAPTFPHASTAFDYGLGDRECRVDNPHSSGQLVSEEIGRITPYRGRISWQSLPIPGLII
jgi:hypothetical protein